MLNGETSIERPLRWGMVGGGRTGQVGYKHRTGALRDGTRAPLEDYATVLMHYDNGARGYLWVSSVDAGNMGSQRYRLVGSKASVEWSDSHPDHLIYEVQGEPNRTLHHGMPYLEPESLVVDRMGALHTEGLGDKLVEHLSLDRPGHRRQAARRRCLSREPSLSRHRSRHRGRALARELRPLRRRRFGLGRFQLTASQES